MYPTIQITSNCVDEMDSAHFESAMQVLRAWESLGANRASETGLPSAKRLQFAMENHNIQWENSL